MMDEVSTSESPHAHPRNRSGCGAALCPVADAERALLQADRVLGSPRQWQSVARLFAADTGRRRLSSAPPAQLPALLHSLELQELAVLASGDPSTLVLAAG